MNQKCHILQGSSTTACFMKILRGERANEFGRTQRETERRQKFLRTIFAFITLETTKVIGRVLPSTNHLLFCDGPCDLSVASSCFDDTQISFFSSKNSDTKIFFAAPLYRAAGCCWLRHARYPLILLFKGRPLVVSKKRSGIQALQVIIAIIKAESQLTIQRRWSEGRKKRVDVAEVEDRRDILLGASFNCAII